MVLSEKLVALAQKIADDSSGFFEIKGPGKGDKATNEFMKELQSQAKQLFGEDFSEKGICGDNKFAVDFFFPEEATIVEIALTLRNASSEFSKDILKAILSQKAGSDEIFYYCRAHYCPWIKNPCNYRKFIPASWDDGIWDDLCRLLRNDEWLEAQLGEEQNRLQDKGKLIHLEENKIRQAKQRLIRIQDGWEKGVYTEAEAGVKVKELRQIIVNTKQEIENINAMYMRENLNLDSLRQELLSLRSQNLEEANFEEKAELIARLGVKIIPTEDLKTRRICCRLNLGNTQKRGGENGLTKVTFGGAGVSIGRTFEVAFNLAV